MWPLLFTSALLFAAAALFDFRHLFWPAVVHAATAHHPVQFVPVPQRRATGAPRPVRQTAPEVLDREAVARLLAPDPEQPIIRKSA
jgi:hypothetical protein